MKRNESYVSCAWDTILFMHVSTIEFCIRSSPIWHTVQLVVSLSTRIVLSKGKNHAQGIATLFIDTEIIEIVCIARGLVRNEMA